MKNYFSSLFGDSPVAPLEQHAELCKNAAETLINYFKAVGQQNWDDASKIRDDISRLENEADEIKKAVRLGLPKSLFMPVPREDVLELLLVQDKIANRAKDIAGIVLGRKLRIPEQVFEDFLRYVERNVDAARQARKSVQELTDLFASGFRGAEVELVQSMINELDAIETDTDQLQTKIRHQLYAIESDYPPIDMMFLYQVITLIGEVGDFSERTGRRLELMLSS